MRVRCTMRIGSRRKVCAIVRPGETGADKPSPMGSSSAELFAARRGLVRLAERLRPLRELRHPVALAHDLHQRLPDRLPTGERGERPLEEMGVLGGRVVLHGARDPVDLGDAPTRLHRLVRVAVLHETFSRPPGRRRRKHRRRRRSRGGRAAARSRPVRARSPAGRNRARARWSRSAPAPRSRPPPAARRPPRRSATRPRRAPPDPRRPARGRRRARRTAGGRDPGAAAAP